MQKNIVTFRFLSEPSDVNFGGKVHGGAVMKWIDQAAYTCAVNWSSQYCVTVYVGGIRFLNPIHIGDIVEVQARLIYTGRSSMHISVDIATLNPKTKAEAKAKDITAKAKTAAADVKAKADTKVKAVTAKAKTATAGTTKAVGAKTTSAANKAKRKPVL